MNIFYDGKFRTGEFSVSNGVFESVTVKEYEDTKDSDYVIPGLLDIHSHGRTGEDFSFVDEEKVMKLAKSYAACGVTSVLATTMTNDPAVIERSIRAIGNVCKSELMDNSARVFGVHMEGPFLGRDKKGAHDEKYLSGFDDDWFERMREESGNAVKIVSIDPNLEESAEFIKKYVKQGIVVSLAHSSADYDTAIKAGEAGADHVTHLFNAMNPLNHRAPAIIGAAFDRQMYSEIICDGIHVSPTLIRMWFKMMPERMIVISDSMQAAGLSDGEYSLGGLDVTVKNGKATLKDGTIAGSTTNIHTELQNLIKFGINREDAILAATLNPARSIRSEDKIGQIKKGCFADYLVTDKDFNIKEVVIGGKIVK